MPKKDSQDTKTEETAPNPTEEKTEEKEKTPEATIEKAPAAPEETSAPTDTPDKKEAKETPVEEKTSPPTPDTEPPVSQPPAPEPPKNEVKIEMRDAEPADTSSGKKISLDEIGEKKSEEKTNDAPSAPVKTVEEPTKVDATPPKEEEVKKEEAKEEPATQDTLDLDDKPSSLDKKNKKIFAIGIIVVAFILLATGILLFLILGNSGAKEEKTVKEEVVKEKITPVEEKLDKEDWTFEVLNGSGISGLATKKATALENAGYTVVKKGNADNQKYEISELFVTEEMESKAKLLIEDLKADFKVTEVKGKLTDSTASARIILGKDQTNE